MNQKAVRVGTRLKELRTSRGWSQQKVSDDVGCARNTLSDIERGKYLASSEILEPLADYYGVSLEDLLREETEIVTDFERQRHVRKLQQQVSALPTLVLHDITSLVETVVSCLQDAYERGKREQTAQVEPHGSPPSLENF